jgi:hypothetical protein
MPARISGNQGTPTVRDAFEQLLAGRLDRRKFIRIAVGLGRSAAGAPYASEFGGHTLQPLDFESLLPAMESHRWTRSTPLFWEHEGNAAVRDGNLKLVGRFKRPWELYDMEVDRTELHGLSHGNRRLLDQMTTKYEHWAGSVGVIDWNVQQPKLLAAWEMKDERGRPRTASQSPSKDGSIASFAAVVRPPCANATLGAMARRRVAIGRRREKARTKPRGSRGRRS